MSSHFFAGLDLGQAADFTALTIVERITPPAARPVMASPLPTEQRVLYWELDGQRLNEAPPKQPTRYDVRHIERFRLGTPYPAIVEQINDLLKRPELGGAVTLVVDGTGVGRPVVDLFRTVRGRRIPLVPVVITSGEAVTLVDGWWHVTKQHLISTVQVLLQSKHLRIGQFPETAVLTAELQNYQVKTTPAANEVFNAREGAHDDLVLALALACWYGEAEPKPQRRVPSVSFWSPA